MSALFTSPHLTIDNEKDSWSYRYLDGHGRVLATAVQVAGPAPPKGFFARHFGSNSHNMARIVLRVDGLSPEASEAASAPPVPLFFLDRAEVPHATAVQPPCAVVAPDGRVVGRVVHDTASFAQSYLEGLRDPSRPVWQHSPVLASYAQAYQLVDDQNRPLCTVKWQTVTLRRRASSDFGSDVSARGGQHCTFTDPQGVDIARYEVAGDLQFHYQLPQPLRVLVTAAPVAMDLMSAVSHM